jgi:membrane-associated phospholipid phosphatase
MADRVEHSDAGADPNAPATRTYVVLGALVLAYVLSLLLLVALDHAAVVWKSLVVPGLALAAAGAGRLRAFARDWAVFLGAVVLFDASRGLVFGLVTYFELPVYMHYAIDAERALFGDPLLTVRVQSWLAPGGQLGAIDRVLAVIYGSHFVAFLLFGLALWMLREREFGRFKVAMLLLMYTGAACYLLVPTVPPWMAAHVYHVLPGVQDIGSELFHGSLPGLTAAFELNPVAAMPSLHCAFPTLVTLIAFREFPRWALPMAAYTGLVYLSTIHLAHHYAVDVLGGIALALACYVAVYRSGNVARLFGALTPPATTAGALRVRILATGLLLALTHASGVYGPALTGGLNPLPSEEFIARELDRRSPMASYYRGMRAFDAGRYAEAKRLLLEAAKEVPAASRGATFGTLVLTAYEDHDYATVLSVAQHLDGMPPGVALIVAESLVRTGQHTRGFELLESVARDHPGHPDVDAVRVRLAHYRQDS